MSLTAGELAQALSGRLDGPAELSISGIAGLDEATSDQVTFISDARHARRWQASHACAALVTDGVEPSGHDPAQRTLIYVPNAELAVIEVLHRFDPGETCPEDGVHPSAVVHATARIGTGVRIGAGSTIGPASEVGDGAVLWPGVHLYGDVIVGAGSVLHSGAVLRSRTRIGRNVVIHPNVTIGSDGFGYRPAADGLKLVKMPHIGRVVIEDDVEIGANTCVDRGKFGATRIGAGTKVDNIVQIGHNVQIGRSCVIAAATSIGGSTQLGDGVVIGGAAAVRDHITIGDGAMIGGRAGVTCDVPAGAAWTGFPAGPAIGKLREWAAQRKLPGLIRELTAVARRGAAAAGPLEKRDAPDHG